MVRCGVSMIPFHVFLGVEDMRDLYTTMRLLIHFHPIMSHVYSVSSNVTGGPLACKCRQDVKFCIFTVMRDIYPCSKYYRVIVYGGKIAKARIAGI